MIEMDPIRYHMVREEQERKLAVAASEASIAAIHTDMADRHARLAGSGKAEVAPPATLRLA